MAFGSEWVTYCAFILIRNLCINLRGWCQIGSWESGWWGTVNFMWRSITTWKGREKPTSSWWRLCLLSNATVFRPSLVTSSGILATQEITQSPVLLFNNCCKVVCENHACCVLQGTLSRRPVVEMIFSTLHIYACEGEINWWCVKWRWLWASFILRRKTILSSVIDCCLLKDKCILDDSVVDSLSLGWKKINQHHCDLVTYTTKYTFCTFNYSKVVWTHNVFSECQEILIVE